jgi:hypothetical protein
MIWCEMEWVSLRPERFVITRTEDLSRAVVEGMT